MCVCRRRGAAPSIPGVMAQSPLSISNENKGEMSRVCCVWVRTLVALADCRRQIEMDSERFCWSTKPFYLWLSLRGCGKKLCIIHRHSHTYSQVHRTHMPHSHRTSWWMRAATILAAIAATSQSVSQPDSQCADCRRIEENRKFQSVLFYYHARPSLPFVHTFESA